MSYDRTAKISEVIERISYVIETATPELAPSAVFTRHTDTTCALHNVTDPGRFRLFLVRLGRPLKGPQNWGAEKASYSVELKVQVGYPLEDFEEIGGVRYLVEDLKSHDFEQIDWLLTASNPFRALDDDHPAIEDVDVTVGDEVFPQQDLYGGRIRQSLYRVDLLRTHE